MGVPLKNIGLLSILMLFGFFGSAQVSLEVQSNHENEDFPNQWELEKSYESRFALEQKLKTVLKKMWREGYLEASFDSLTYIDSTRARVQWVPGEQYQWAILEKGNVDEAWLTKIGFRRKVYEQKPFKPRKMTALMEALLTFAENNGYPFAKVKLDSTEIKEHTISGMLRLEKGQKYTYGELEILGDVDISKQYLRNYLNLKEAEPYKEKDVQAIEPQIKALSFLKSDKAPEITFKNNGKIAIRLFLDSRNANRVNGILGLMPNSENNKRFLVTGQVDLGLKNPFGKAMGFELHWEKNQPRTQELNIDYHYPFLFNLPVGVDFQMDLLKFDSLFLNISTEFGVRYLMKGANYLRGFYNNEQSNLIGDQNPNNAIENTDFSGYSTNFYGLEGHFEKLDYRLNPTKGYQITAEGSVGTKSFSNPEAAGKEGNGDIEEKSLIYRVKLDASYYFKLGKQSTLKFRGQGSHLADDQIVYNQLFRFGGLGSLRGFDDKSLLAGTYGIATIEYRYLTGTDAFLKAFWDGAYYERNTLSTSIKDTPYGFGIGYNFRTKAGIFSLNYALGKQKNSNINFRQGKIHFGITNVF